MLLLFNKIGMVYKSKKVVIEVVKNSYKGSFITEGYFLGFFDNLRDCMESSVVKCILSIILLQPLIDLTWTDL